MASVIAFNQKLKLKSKSQFCKSNIDIINVILNMKEVLV